MTVQTDTPQPDVKYVDAEGRLTIDGVLLLQKMKNALDDHEKRLTDGAL